ncbi:methyltransferase domain-containing protein [Candidatus Woesearchaeota archaeon]|nr:methyltransferase domain-containing protein [Candidatus Woesearchaeota archaeon]
MPYYDELAPGYDALHREEQENKLRIIAEHLRLGPSDILLDVGCGTGFSLGLLPCRSYGCDPSLEMVRHAEGRAVCARGEALPFKDRSFDVVIAVSAIHHFDDVSAGLDEIRRVGKQRFAFSLFRRAEKYDAIVAAIGERFSISHIVLERKDAIVFCTASS